MFTFRKVRTLLPWRAPETPWFAVSFGGQRIGYVYRQAAGRWAGNTEKFEMRDNPPVVAHSREAAAEALLWRVDAKAQGTGEPV